MEFYLSRKTVRDSRVAPQTVEILGVCKELRHLAREGKRGGASHCQIALCWKKGRFFYDSGSPTLVLGIYSLFSVQVASESKKK